MKRQWFCLSYCVDVTCNSTCNSRGYENGRDLEMIALHINIRLAALDPVMKVMGLSRIKSIGPQAREKPPFHYHHDRVAFMSYLSTVSHAKKFTSTSYHTIPTLLCLGKITWRPRFQPLLAYPIDRNSLIRHLDHSVPVSCQADEIRGDSNSVVEHPRTLAVPS